MLVVGCRARPVDTGEDWYVWTEDGQKMSPTAASLRSLVEGNARDLDPVALARMSQSMIDVNLGPNSHRLPLTRDERVEVLRYLIGLGEEAIASGRVEPQQARSLNEALVRGRAALVEMEREMKSAAGAKVSTLQSELAAVEKLLEDQSLDAATRATLEAEAVRLREALRPVAKP
jgi:hypothetical protein